MTGLQNSPYFRAVQGHVDNMLAHGRGIVDGEPCPLFAGVVDVVRRKPVTYQTPPPPGIRVSDFNWCGNNLMHDLPLLEVMNQLTILRQGDHYSEAVEDIYEYYGRHCPHPETGLFPWGEHTQWSFEDKAILPNHFTAGMKHWEVDGYLIHDHLAFTGHGFWDGMCRHHPEVAHRFAHGLDRHIVDRKTFEHNRHGGLSSNWWHDPNQPATGTGKDFARHSGFYIFDCISIYNKTRDEGLVEWSRQKLNWHLQRRLPNGIISGCVRSSEERSEGQHDGLGLSLMDAGNAVGETDLGDEFHGYADELFAARAKQSREVTVPDCPSDGRIWIDGYFRKPHAVLTPSNVNLPIFRAYGIQYYADVTVAHADWLSANLVPPDGNVPVLARRFAEFIELLTTAHFITGEAAYLETAFQVAEWALRDLNREGFLLGCSNLSWTYVGSNLEMHWDPWAPAKHPGFYYSVTGTNNLIRALLRLTMVQNDKYDFLGPDPYRR